jgi:hypothetical protein
VTPPQQYCIECGFNTAGIHRHFTYKKIYGLAVATNAAQVRALGKYNVVQVEPRGRCEYGIQGLSSTPGIDRHGPHQWLGKFCCPNFLVKTVLSELLGHNAWCEGLILQVIVNETVLNTSFYKATLHSINF